MSIFDQINQGASQAQQGQQAQQAQAAHAAANFRSHSDATQPTADFALGHAPLGVTLYGYQQAAVETILLFGRALLGFAPGMGKTIIAQTAIANDGKKTIVVVPPSLRLMWVREFQRFFPHLSVQSIAGTKQADIDDSDVLIVGDSIVAKRLDDLKAWGGEALYLDEAHRIKNLKAKRTAAVLDLAEHITLGTQGATIVGLTGTLTINRPDEAFAPIRMTGKSIATNISGGASMTSFIQRWCVTESIRVAGGKIINNVVGCSDPEMLHERLRSNVYVRVEREDVLDMPSKVWKIQDMILNGDFKEYERAEADFIRWIAETSGDKAAQRAAKAEAIVKLNKLRELAGKCKTKTACPEYVLDLVDQGEQVVVMVHNVSVAAAMTTKLMEKGVEVVEIVGGMTAQAKQNAEDAFRSGEAQVLVGNIDAAGVGLNLDSACHLVFVQLPWSPGALQQAADRIYRMTQERACTIHVLNAAYSVDERMWGIIQAKANVVDAINAGQPTTLPEGSVVDGVLESYGW